MEDWRKKWLLLFHLDKCKHLHIGREINEYKRYELHQTEVQKIREEKQLGTIIDKNLKFREHIMERIKKGKCNDGCN